MKTLSGSSRITLLVLCAALCPLLGGAGCPASLGLGGGAHQGDWVANNLMDVTLYRFGADGSLRLAQEIYAPLPMVDGMKLELEGRCEVVSGDVTAHSDLLVGEGWSLLRCDRLMVRRATQGMALLLNSSYGLIGLLGGAEQGDDGVSITVWLGFKRDGGALVLRAKDEEHQRLEESRLEPVDGARAEAFLERFREDTVEVRPPSATPTSVRKRDLP